MGKNIDIDFFVRQVDNVNMIERKTILFLIIYTISFFQFDNAYSIENKTEKISLKQVLSNKHLLEKFLEKNLNTLTFENSNEVKEVISNATQGIFLNNILGDSIFISEFIFRITKSKSALAKLLSIFMEGKKFIYFSIFIIFTIIASTLLSEFQHIFKLFSGKRTLFMLIRHLGINIFRVWGFIYLFGEHLSPSFNIYLNTVAATKDTYPIFYGVNLVFSMIL